VIYSAEIGAWVRFTSDDIQTTLAVVTLVATTGGWLFDRYVVRRRRISYRVHWDRPVDATPNRRDPMRLSISHNGSVVDQPSYVVLRVENVGSFDVATDDVVQPLQFSFGGRKIVHYQLQNSNPAGLIDEIVPQDGSPGPELAPYHPGQPDEVAGGTLWLPRFAMPRKARFKILVLLSGEGSRVSARAQLTGGEIVAEEHRGARSRRGLALGGVSLLVAGLLVGLIVTRPTGPQAGSTADPVDCPQITGQVTITGSTTLQPVIKDLAARYTKRCPAANVQVDDTTNTSSGSALDELLNAGRLDEANSDHRNQLVKLAMADEYAGKAAAGAPLEYWPIGVGAFAIIVNKDANISNLSPEQLRQLYAGKYLKWSDADLGGADLDIKLVSRPDTSGTRDAFEHRVLNGHESAPVQSTNCVSPDLGPQNGVMHCTMKTTDDMLKKVGLTSGAIGYASADEAYALQQADKGESTGIKVIPIDAISPGKQAIADGSYKFWAVEKLYRYGPKRSPTARDYFADYVLTQTEVLESHGFYSCKDSAFLYGEVSTACQQGASTGPAPAAG
jgi:phosphate transport system substrate-binding protein